MNNYITPVLLVLLIYSHLTPIAHKQSQGWSVYSSTADQFTVAVPPGVVTLPNGRVIKARKT